MPTCRACSLLSLRKKSSELEEKREELLELQDFTADIIHSMRGGLVTTDMQGRVVLLNRTGEEIIGSSFSELRGRDLREVSSEFWLDDMSALPERLSVRREIEVSIPSGQRRFLGISVSPLRTRDTTRSGYVFNFQDLTELRRLEQEVATKERMAAVGRLSAAIAHEIRQPLTAIAGAVKELGRLVPLEEDEKHLVNIVSRESERLNHIITDFLNYSREKSYAFQEEDVRALLEETLLLMERKPDLVKKVHLGEGLQWTGFEGPGGPQQNQTGVLESLRQCSACDAGWRNIDRRNRAKSRLAAHLLSGYGGGPRTPGARQDL